MKRIMHDDHGYFIGRCELGRPHRLSREYYGSIESCRQALDDKSWTRRPMGYIS